MIEKQASVPAGVDSKGAEKTAGPSNDTAHGTNPIEARILAARAEGRAALIPFVVAGRPTREHFAEVLCEVARSADVVELGLPFSDPVADGPVIAEASRKALAEGMNLTVLLDEVSRLELDAPLVLFSYLNPLLAGGIRETVARIAAAGFAGLVVPDLTLETGSAATVESRELDAACRAQGLAWIQLVTPLTTPERRQERMRLSRGFLYAVLRTGITGGRTCAGDATGFLDALRAQSSLPVCAGFGLRDAEQARALREHADGLIVGTALVELIERGESPAVLLEPMREAGRATPS